MKKLLEKIDREEDSHKGENGRVGVIAGSKDYSGAPALAAEAALRTGCDLVKILTSKKVADTVASFSENFIVEEYEENYFNMEAMGKALQLDRWADAVVIGPGLGEPEAKAIRQFIEESSSALVIDADALKHVGGTEFENAILTPHSREFEQHVEEILEPLLDRGNVVLKKGEIDRVYSSGGEKKVEAGHPGMTVGGTGDVLTGVVASLLSQGLNKKDAAELGAFLNGKAGEKAAEKYGNEALATDLIEFIPEVME